MPASSSNLYSDSDSKSHLLGPASTSDMSVGVGGDTLGGTNPSTVKVHAIVGSTDGSLDCFSLSSSSSCPRLRYPPQYTTVILISIRVL